MPVSKAVIEDVDDLVQLINSAYRGEASKKGWTTEADLLQGELRTDAPMLADIIAKPQAVILKYTNDEGTITGSVFLEKQERGLYLGMLSVSPLQQATGVGKQLMKAAEQYAKEKWCSFIFMNVISIRHELIKWYERLGYQETSETKPVVVDPRFGVPTQPLEFVIMEKKM
ncbi:MAG: GNAT family N-acetyltransferase [Chitinophagaceae bacterium]|jgi:ribosomal protein S18 acetylase RimI-like enzyme|nr:GNAT family N-acetyltransferase [Chitinophagaceae bacterium]MBK7679339.1 GNAT family N-acetyltransferase [Chitinophagaceae bacterium]MBK8299318.1 GNAT family N-acetyltransferase [Chitinophagaceae bacterium]MBK9661278.1 GNAT family N-acetyltransferase [Chitinophagaceae bacterium]MBK9936961.1 GNAT family N-acetyltransferase [Chitinophagaceae bacterium]